MVVRDNHRKYESKTQRWRPETAAWGAKQITEPTHPAALQPRPRTAQGIYRSFVFMPTNKKGEWDKNQPYWVPPRNHTQAMAVPG